MKHYDAIFVSGKDFVYIVPMKSSGEFHLALKMFSKEIGVPLYLILYPSKEQTSAKVKNMCHKMGTTLKILKESTHNDNHSERYVGLTMTLIRKDLRESKVPNFFVGFMC